MRVDHTAPVLVVDDQTIMVDLTRRVLSRLGFERSTASRTAREHSLDFVLASIPRHL